MTRYVVLNLSLNCIVVNFFNNALFDLVFNYVVVLLHRFRIIFELFDGRDSC